MNILFFIYVTLMLTLTLCFVAIVHIKQRPHTESQHEQYIRQITVWLAEEGCAEFEIRARNASERMALAEAIHTVVSHTYGNDISCLKQIVEYNSLDRFLLRRTRLSRGAQRAHMLTLMSTIPLHRISLGSIMRYQHSANADVRISALIILLAANPTLAIRAIEGLGYDLSPFDIARIMALLRRGVLPIAYEPLLGSNNRNLRILGLAIVRAFGIEIAERRLHHIISTDQRPTIAREAIYTLASLGRPLHHAGIRQRVDTMSQTDRHLLCRHLSAEGYSIGVVKAIFSEPESRYAEILINSYKRTLTRNTIVR